MKITISQQPQLLNTGMYEILAFFENLGTNNTEIFGLYPRNFRVCHKEKDIFEETTQERLDFVIE
ncbi:hypothetical protein OUZ56_012379 [Daphnia magna]|uniref:Uncharacterized protein n=1 Tax=Daphnia magna TaxID=35525 RepID=A0ABQ9Z2U3_9CRUS|nr:hypothetical protein OUZ56_012379 [Daphnia magna]